MPKEVISPTILRQFSNDLRFAVDLAHVAGQALIDSRGGLVTQKEGTSNFQTDGDLNSERVILRGISRQFPQDSILSEETRTEIDRPLEIPRLWVVDPCDGTANYADGIDEVWVAIGLIKHGEGHVGVAHNPFQRKTYFAESNKGAFLFSPKAPGSKRMEVKRIHVGNRTELKDATIETSMSYDPAQSRYHNIIKLYLSFLGMDVRPREIGSSVGQICRVAQGLSDAHMHSGLKAWDYAGPIVVLKEANGVSKTFNLSDHNPLVDRDNISGNPVIVGKLGEVIEQIKGNKNFIKYLGKIVKDFTI